MSSVDGLYSLTRQVLAAFPRDSFCRVDSHDPDEPNHPDFLWLTYTPDDDLSEGDRVCISPAGADAWFVDIESVHNFGGTVSHWNAVGDAASLLAALPDQFDA